jgi:hypothetical protein
MQGFISCAIFPLTKGKLLSKNRKLDDQVFGLFREWNDVEFPKLQAFWEFLPSFPKQPVLRAFREKLDHRVR